MRVRKLGANVISMSIADVELLISYETICAAWIDGELYTINDRTPTTAKHINQWAPATAKRTTVSVSGLAALITATLKGA